VTTRKARERADEHLAPKPDTDVLDRNLMRYFKARGEDSMRVLDSGDRVALERVRVQVMLEARREGLFQPFAVRSNGWRPFLAGAASVAAISLVFALLSGVPTPSPQEPDWATAKDLNELLGPVRVLTIDRSSLPKGEEVDLSKLVSELSLVVPVQVESFREDALVGLFLVVDQASLGEVNLILEPYEVQLESPGSFRLERRQ